MKRTNIQIGSNIDEDAEQFIQDYASRQGEENCEDSMSDKEYKAEMGKQLKQPTKAQIRRRQEEQVTLENEEMVTLEPEPKATSIDEKREKVRTLKKKMKTVKTAQAKERAKPIVTDEKTSNQITYLRSGGLTPAEIDRLMNWMSSWSKDNKESLYKRLRATKDEDQLESVLKRLSIEATLRGF